MVHRLAAETMTEGDIKLAPESYFRVLMRKLRPIDASSGDYWRILYSETCDLGPTKSVPIIKVSYFPS